MAFHQLSDFAYFEMKIGIVTLQVIVVHNKNMADLLNTVLLLRNVLFDHIVKVGIDGGKGFLRFCLWIVDRNPFIEVLEKSPRQKRLLTQRKAKDTGVKSQIKVAAAENMKLM